MYISIHMYVCMCICVCIYIHVCKSIQIYTHIDEHMYAHIYLCLYTSCLDFTCNSADLTYK